MTDWSDLALAGGALILRVRPPIAVIVLNRPEARNAINQAMWRAAPEAVDRVAQAASVRVVILKGAGGHFASGADIAEFGDIFSSPSNAEDYLALMEAAGEALENLPKPAIALIEGYCIGAGLALALACDLRIAASGARLGAPPAKLGLVYGPGDIRRLVAAVGVEAAKSMLFTGALVPAETALSMGLVSELHDGDAAAAAHRRAEAIAALSPWSIRTTKAMINLLERADPGYRSQGRAWFADAVEQGDLAEGVLAFSQRRAPIFRD